MGKENGTYYIIIGYIWGLYRGYIGIMENKMELLYYNRYDFSFGGSGMRDWMKDLGRISVAMRKRRIQKQLSYMSTTGGERLIGILISVFMCKTTILIPSLWDPASSPSYIRL